jgi:hypothetical protein
MVSWRLPWCSGLFWSLPGSLLLFPGPSMAWGGRCSGRFLERLLSEFFTWRWCLPSWSDEVDGLASPLHWPMAHSLLPRRQGLPVRCCLVLSWWWLVMFVGEREASRGIVIGSRFCPLQYLPRHSDIGWRRDGFSTLVLGARGSWVPTPEYMLSGIRTHES